MDYTIEFETNSQDVIPKVKRYFVENKFNLQSEAENETVFTRGNDFLNKITFNPLSWKSNIQVSVKGKIVHLRADISTIGQIVTEHEAKLWEDFFENFKKSIIQDLDVSSDNKKAMHETKKKSFYLILKLIGIVAAAGLIIGIIKGMIILFFKSA